MDRNSTGWTRPTLESERLRLVPISAAAHYGGARRMAADAEVMRYLTGTPELPEQTMQFFARVEERWQLQRYSWWAILRDSDMVGAAAMQHISGDERQPIEIGWRLARAEFGKGYATEAARVIVDYARSEKIPELYAVADPLNLPSQRVMMRLGMQSVGIQTHYSRPCATYVLELTD